MFSNRDLKDLLSYRPENKILNVFLNTDPAEGNADTHKLRLRSMLKDNELSTDVQSVIRYFEHEHEWTGRSAVVFSCVPDEFFKAYSLAIPLRSRIRTSNRPYVKPLADLLDMYGGYGIVIIDKQGARLFHFHLGELHEEEGVIGESIRRTKRGGGSQAAGRRGGTAGQTNYIDEVAERNIKDAVESSVKFFADNNIRRLLIGGSEDNIAQFKAQLPKSWQSLIVGTFAISMTANQNEILEKALEISKAAQFKREAHLINILVTNAAKEQGGVIHLENTLKAVHEGRVKTLLIRDGFQASGTRCMSCGYISAETPETCTYCGGDPEEIPDAVELAVRKVMQSNGVVEVIHSSHDIEGFENIGALLRY